MLTPTWTPEREAELRRLRAEGKPFAEIARLLGVTKNSAIGRAGRIGIPRDPANNPVRRAPCEVALPQTPVVRRTCQWIENDDIRQPLFCGAPVSDPGKPYCTEHATRCYAKTPNARATSFDPVFANRAARRRA